MVLLYSARFNRLSVTRPGSLTSPQSTFVRVVMTEFRNVSFSSLVGCSFAFLGGMAPDAN
jgi:hypothetical protein